MGKKTLDQLRMEIDEKAREILERRLLTIEQDVNKYIDSQLRRIVSCALGLDDRWGRVEVDHCNGRATEIANRLGQRAMTVIESKFNEWANSLETDTVALENAKIAMKKEYDEQLRDKLRTRIREWAQRAATSECDRLMALPMPEEKKDGPQYLRFGMLEVD